jgi:hypothetical protein
MNARQRKSVTKALLDELSKHGIISAACKRAGLSKAQYYRWHKDDPIFKEAADEALVLGLQEANDLARSRLLQKIDQGEGWAIRYQLSRRDPSYRLPPERVMTGGLSLEKDALISSSYQVLASAIAQGDIKAAQFILERTDEALMRPKDSLLLGQIRSREEASEEIRKNGELLSRLFGMDVPGSKDLGADASSPEIPPR